MYQATGQGLVAMAAVWPVPVLLLVQAAAALYYAYETNPSGGHDRSRLTLVQGGAAAPH